MTRERMERILLEAELAVLWLRLAHRCDGKFSRDDYVAMSAEHVTNLYALCGLEGR